MPRSLSRVAGRVFLGGLALLAGCSDTALERVPESPPARPDLTVRVDGTLCSRDPVEIRFPVRIAFIVDTSQSMTISDPPDPVTGLTGRQRAVQAVVNSLGVSDEVAYSILAFSGTTNVLTGIDTDGDGMDDDFGYTSDPEELDRAIRALAIDASTTNYLAALADSYALAFREVLRQPPDEVTRSKFVFVFISDGLPDSDDAQPVSTDDLLAAVQDIVELEAQLDVGDVVFHTAYVSANATPQVQEAASDLLGQMAEVGEGTFRSYPTGQAIDFLTIDFTSIRRVFALTDLVVSNLNARPLEGATDVDGDGRADGERSLVPEPDSDGDGLSDAQELLDGFSDPERVDTDGDGFGDALEWRLVQSGGDFDATDPGDGLCPSEVDRRDLDGDGLRDCEELYFGSNPRFFDSDLDGLPDPVEVAAGTDAASVDANADPDVDGGDNSLEIRSHTDPLVWDAADRAARSYLYDVTQLPISGSTACQNFRVSSISLAPTLSGWSEIRIWASERPFDRPDSFSLWRVACVRARYLEAEQAKIPADGRLEVGEADFVAPEEFDPAIHCLTPEQ